MKSFVEGKVLTRGWVLLSGTMIAVGVFAALWFGQPESVPMTREEAPSESPVQTVATDTLYGELVQTILEENPGFSREIVEAIAEHTVSIQGLDFEEMRKLQAEFAERLWTLQGATGKGIPPEWLPVSIVNSERGSAQDWAEDAYDRKWREFIAGMGLADEQVVRNIVTTWEAFNFELDDQYATGVLGFEEHREARMTMEELQASLAPHLSEDQLVAIAVNEEMYFEYHEAIAAAYEAEEQALGYKTDILVAVRGDDLPAVRGLVRSGADVNHTTGDGRWTPLRRAARDGSLEIAEILIDAGADVNWRNADNRTPLMDAAMDGHRDVVRLLASKGADLDLERDGGFTALSQAARYNHTEVVRELLDWGADATGTGGRYALNSAREYGNREMERLLRDAGASIGFSDLEIGN